MPRFMMRARCEFIDDDLNCCTKRAASQRHAIVARGTIWAPYVICKGIRYPLCRAHATSDEDRSALLGRLLGTWPLV